MIGTLSALLLAALLPTAADAPEPRCRAELDGNALTTTLAYPDGYSVQGPWRVLQTAHSLDGAESLLVVDLSLDRVVEEDGITGRRTTTPLANPVMLTFEAPSEPELVHLAAQTWCRTVMRARAGNASGPGRGPPLPGRIA